MNKKDKFEIAAEGVRGQPEDAFEQINKYGTYNLQPTNDTDNEFPAIAQGLAKSHHRNIKKQKQN